MLLAAEELDTTAAVTAGLVQRVGEPTDAVDAARHLAVLAPLTTRLGALRATEADAAAVAAAFDRVWASADRRGSGRSPSDGLPASRAVDRNAAQLVAVRDRAGAGRVVHGKARCRS